MFSNIHFTFLGNDKDDSDNFWNNVAYYNFVQEPMNTNKKRPAKTDFRKGWDEFAKLINILKPSTCIFFGNSCSAQFPQNFSNDIKILAPITDDGWINRTASRKATLQLNDEHVITLLFIRHPSSFYKYSDWNKHLTTKIPDLMNWLKE